MEVQFPLESHDGSFYPEPEVVHGQFCPGTQGFEGLVVQLVERRIRIAEIRGSTPLESTKKFTPVK